MANMDPVAVSAGSACSAGSIEPSAVLLAMGLSRDAAFESVRFSLGRFTSEEDIESGSRCGRRGCRACPINDKLIAQAPPPDGSWEADAVDTRVL